MDRLLEALEPFDRMDLTATAGALQLMPENANRVVRAYGFAGISASLPARAGLPRISAGRLRGYLNGPLAASRFARGEDPFDNPFVDEVAFDGGPYLVLPGVDADSPFVVRRLAKAATRSPKPYSDPGFAAEARILCASVLALSHEIVERAGLDRFSEPEVTPPNPVFVSPERLGEAIEASGVPPSEALAAAREQLRGLIAPTGEVVVPGAERIGALRDAVTFTRDELRRLLVGVGARLEDLDVLVLEQGSVNVGDLGVSENPLFVRPIVRDDDRYVVAAPRALLMALCNALIRLAKNAGVEEQLAANYAELVFLNVQSSLDFLGNELLTGRTPEESTNSFYEVAFRLDDDKVINLVLATDGLSDYDPEKAESRWLDRDLEDKLRTRLREAEAEILERPGAPNDVLHLVLVQGVGSGYASGFAATGGLACPRQLTMSASDLEVVALLEGGDPQVLWKYAGVRERVREHRGVMSLFGQLKEFYHYRANDYTYYLSDERRDLPMIVPLGGAGALRREVRRVRDFHGVGYLETGRTIEVTSLFDDASIPVYAPWRGGRPGPRVEILVEGLPFDVWLVGPETLPEPRYHPLYFAFADMISYWIWQMTPGLVADLERLADNRHQIQVHLDLVPDDGWFRGSSPSASGPPIEHAVDAEANLRLTLRSEVARRLEGADNAGEREVMREVLRGVRSVHAASVAGTGAGPSDARIEELLDRYAPLGIRKKLMFLSGTRNVQHQDEGLPLYRKVQPADTNELLDEIGDHLSSGEGLRTGRIPDERRTEVMNKAVAFLFGQLEDLVSTLSPEGVLDVLVARNERIVYQQAQHRLLTPTRIACFESEAQMVERIGREGQELSLAALASRFLIEYVCARPPQGFRPLSLSVYDRLLALSAEIINRGMMSDAIRYGIANLKLSMLPSGRLGMRTGTFEEGRDRFMEVYREGEVYRSTAAFDRHWRGPSGARRPAEANEIDAAVRAEFGLTLTELLEFFRETIEEGRDLQGEPKVMPVAGFVERLGSRLGWDRPRVDRAFDLFSMRPRAAFLRPPTGFDGTDVYPWRFNRGLSYLRRPLLVRAANGGAEEVVWGIRHSQGAAWYLMDLCLGGRLKAETDDMKRLISETQGRDAKEFEDRVAAFYEGKPGWVAQKRVKNVAGLRVEREPGQDLGDIDVLAADTRSRVLWAVEAKSLAFARTPPELANELENTFGTGGSKRSAVEKHMERTSWLRDHLPATLEWLGLPPSLAKKRWRVEPLVAVDHELQTPYVVGSPVTVVPERKLGALHDRG